MASAQPIQGGQMPAKRRFRFLSPPLNAGHRAALLAVATVIAALAFAAPSLASTTPVYYDANGNVGAGPSPFNGTFTGASNVVTGAGASLS